MPFVRVVLVRGKDTVGAPAKLWPNSTSAKAVVEHALGTQEAAVLLEPPVELFPSREMRPAEVTEFDEATLNEATLANIEEHGFGFCWRMRVRLAVPDASFRTPVGGCSTSAGDRGSSASGGNTSSSMPNAFAELGKKKLVLPTPSTVSTFDGPVFNALLHLLDSRSLLLEPADAHKDGAGFNLIKALSKSLAYIIPFDLNGALRRRSKHLPEDFTAAQLEVCI